ncbi:MAG: DUF2065 domain-containing protein [Tateyamaria sp.]|jgi:uncharacterized protein YjeT (DUF2065 family)|nr:DUF2065 domain-containing protein [Tateyamaria sp.]MCH9748297.1 DUF2065 domain-containing protein [Alphaproteobacteria bacterium]MBT5302608.1 DUF2065 domain-containing protein [Tateyamaria sp.]MBT6268114.1 DUF2065 domain-containing protein [Tateyamaria sp.]MBT6344189.1 DUF2065 domain-containing protein [Tateyamaria sp.]
MAWILLAFGLVMIVEGLTYMLAPSHIEKVLEILRSLPQTAKRQFGALILVSGLIFLWLAFFIGL